MMGGGAKVPPTLIRDLEAAFGVRFVNGYGQSETGASITQTSTDDDDRVKAESIGRALPHRELGIFDPDTSEARGYGEIGEIRTRSPLIMREYLGMPEETAEVIGADGWLRTGDLGSMEPDGVVTFHGRVREVIVRGGENLYPREIEEALLSHPEVLEVAVLGRPDERWGETVAAFVRQAPGAALTGAELETHLGDRLARHKVPRTWRFVEEFPLTPSGKIRKTELADSLG